MIAKNLSLRTKITLSFVGITTLALIITSIANYVSGKRLLENASFNMLSAIRDIKGGQITQYIDMLKGQCLSTSESTMIFDALDQLKNGFHALSATPEELAADKKELENFYDQEFLPKLNQTATTPYTLSDYFPLDQTTIIAQIWYLAQNPQPLQKKIDFTRSPIDHAYNTAHEKYHYIFKRYAQRVGITDLYLIDSSTGYVVYSLRKEVDFGSNLMTGPYKDTGLGDAFKEIQKTNDEDFVKIVDFQFYAPSYGTPVGFIGTPIVQGGKKIGVLVFKFPIDDINEIMTYKKQWAEAGLGKTGESFIIGNDKAMRSMAREYIEDPTRYLQLLREHGYDANILDKIQTYDTTVLLKKIDIDAIHEALEGKTNTIITKDSLGRSVILTYAPINIPDMQWYIIAKINTDEAFAPVNALLWYIFLLCLIIICIATIAAFIAIYAFTQPLTRLMRFLTSTSISKSTKLSFDDSTEFTTIANAYNDFIAHIFSTAQKMEIFGHKIQAITDHLTHMIESMHESLTDIGQCNEALFNENNGISTDTKKIKWHHEEHTPFVTQSVTTLNVLHAIATQIMQHLEHATQDLNNLEVIVASTPAQESPNALLIDIKGKLQRISHIHNAITPSLMNLQSNYAQLKSLIADNKTGYEEENMTLASLETHTQRTVDILTTMKHTIQQADNAITEMNSLQKQYSQVTDELTTLITQIKV